MNLNKNIRLLAWFYFFLGFRFYVPILIIYFARVTGSYTLGMSLFAVASISNAVFELPTGIFSDLIGRKRTLVLGAVASFAAVLFYAIGGSYFWLALGSVCQGLQWALFSGNNAALLHDTLTALGRVDEYQEHLGRTYSRDHVGIALGSIMGGVLAVIALPLVMWLTVIPQAINLVVSLYVVEPGVSTPPTGNPYAHLRDALRLLVRSRDLRHLSIASMLGGAIGESGYQLRAAFIEQLWPLWALGMARTLENVLAAVGFHFSGRLIKRFSEFKLLIGGGIMGWIVDMISIAVPTVLSPAAMALMSIFHGTGIVSQDSLFQQRFTTEQRATLGSLVALGGSFLFAVIS
ncbi:MAG: MFS transporter, partial [Anaerolineae bacterium]|nr:MFS transporter [Anaerolineae bacterium]